jgi:hypothetical protein
MTNSKASFAERWTAKERILGLAELGTEFIDCGEAVLPNAAAPCINFDCASSMPTLWKIFGHLDIRLAKDKKRLEGYLVLGFDGAGNPICVEEVSRAIWLLDHEDQFCTRQFVNSGLTQLAECLLEYMGEMDVVRFQAVVGAIDPPALEAGAFWYHEALCIGEGNS